ncbi:hypothetical protein VT84_13875 [Gemmata sp. SH-PL17]|uniref:hypothetical protein n=1 Tax=Gemmata sp. SH-PL17 TaxID=1630693 RepID=UPI00078D96C3|nr:hypothetical protein [Gemmata sp. SH-PL17]AMV25482.1 hypothetical protein VT84_13875 [Gemmata sp. SH-PL17]
MPVYTDLLAPTKSERHGAFTWAPAEDNATSPVAGVLTITGKRSHCRYRVEEHPADEPGRAFVLRKLDVGSDRTEGHYGCFLAAEVGFDVCDCRGFVSTRNCKHLSSLRQLTEAEKL